MADADNRGKLLGKITHVDDSTINLIFNVESPEGKHILIPASEDFIRNIDTGKKIIEVSLPEGLLDLT